MTEFENTAYDSRLEAYLDGVMGGEERALFELELQQNPRLFAEVNLQRRIDDSILREFPALQVSAAHLAAFEKHLAAVASATEATPVSVRWPWLTGLVAAAAACILFLLWSPESGVPHKPTFIPMPLAEVYKKTVAEGFEPYYECRDNERFAETFERRQGVALHLADLPANSTMKGLSYSGGLSRDTTAMLCEVDGKPVMVFVDREEKDRPQASAESDPALNVFREERDGLVLYEVTPLDKPTMTQFMVRAE